MFAIEMRGDRIKSPSFGSAKTTVLSVGWLVQYTDIMRFLHIMYTSQSVSLTQSTSSTVTNTLVLNKDLRLKGTPYDAYKKLLEYGYPA